MWLQILGIITPLVAITATGFFYARYSKPDMRVPNRLNLDIFIPALLYHVLANQDLELGNYAALSVAGVVVVLGSGLLTYPFVKKLGTQAKTFVPPMMFNNCGNLGLPLALLSFGEQGMAIAIVLFIISNTLHISVGSWILAGHFSIKRFLLSPMIIGASLGLIANLTNFDTPAPLMLTAEMLGNIAIPLMLFALGTRMIEVEMTHLKLSLWAGLLCPLSGVIMAIICYWLLNLNSHDFAQLLVFSALPPAVLNYMYAEHYQQEPSKVASIVLVGNLMSILIIPITLAVAFSIM
jgi:predicted permease